MKELCEWCEDRGMEECYANLCGVPKHCGSRYDREEEPDES